MDSFLMYMLFAAGLVLIIKGGGFFVDAATWLAKVSHIPQFIIGATVVSIATTLPELFVSSIAAWEGKTAMATGNAVGSVIANTGLIFSVAVLFIPSALRRRQFVPKSMLFLASVMVLWMFCLSGELTLFACAGMVLLFAVFLIENIKTAKYELDTVQAQPQQGALCSKREAVRNILKFTGGAGAIVFGSHLLVQNGSAIAASLGVQERIISLTAVAVGTSLPELATTVTAIAKRQASLSVGNILGANILDMTLILPVCAFLSGGTLPVGIQTYTLDLPVCLIIAAVMILPTLFTGRFKRWQGALMLFSYGAYVLYICNV